MASPVDFAPILLTEEDENDARRQMAEMLGLDWEERRGPAAWAGFAAESALVRAWNAAGHSTQCRKAPVLAYDLALVREGAVPRFDMGAGCDVARVEVKTRVAVEGWTDPRRFEWASVPTHDGREPIKDVDLAWFCWFSGSQPRRLWVLGYLRGPEEFKRRAVFYREGAPTPRGGEAPAGGEWVLELKQLRPFPRRFFKEDD